MAREDGGKVGFQAVWQIFMVDRPYSGWTDIGDCRVAFTTDDISTGIYSEMCLHLKYVLKKWGKLHQIQHFYASKSMIFWIFVEYLPVQL